MNAHDYLIYRPSNELYHHGIRGQKWGQQNGPPYPLDASDHSSSEKKAGWKKSLDKSSKVSDNKNKSGFQLTDKQKKAIKIGAAVVVTALAAYGTYKVMGSESFRERAKAGEMTLDSALGVKSSSADSVDLSSTFTNGLKNLAKPESISDAIKHANPNAGKSKYRNNCTACSLATYLRTMGYDVTAKSTGGKGRDLYNIIEECFKDADVKTWGSIKFGKSQADAAEMIRKRFGDNASGVFKFKRKGYNSSHALNWQVKDGVVTFFDGQKGYTHEKLSQIWTEGLIDLNGDIDIARLDNLEINYDAIKQYVESAR